MATLQKIRSKGPLLVIAIGLALFAFIAGDAWKVLQPHTTQQNVGEVNGKSISAQDYQKLVDELSEVIKLSNGVNSLSEEQLNQIKDQAWTTYVNYEIVAAEAKKLGLTVTDAEIQNIIDEGTNPILKQTPFINQTTGAFDKDMLKQFLVEYSKLESGTIPYQYAEYYQKLGTLWQFVEKSLRQNALVQKYQDLLNKSLISNPVSAEDSYTSRVEESDVLLAVLPYSTISDDDVTVSNDEIKKLFNERKDTYTQSAETRDIKYVSYKVTPSDADRLAVLTEVTDYTNQLQATESDYASFVRSTGSTALFSDIHVGKTALPSDVAARLDSTTVGDTFGPYYSQTDNSYNVFKIISKISAPDSIQYRQLQVVMNTEAQTESLADSIYNALKGGADFAELAKIYGQTGEPIWARAQAWEGATLDENNAKYVNTLVSTPNKQIVNLKLGQVNLIIQVLDKKVMKDKYKVAVVKRPIEFSKETYNAAYNKFSQFVAQSKTLEELENNAEEFGYSLVPRKSFASTEHYVAGVKSTRDALRWIFSAKAGQVSPLYECGENDNLLVVAVEKINPAGTADINLAAELLRAEVRRDKKAEIILNQVKGYTTIDQMASAKDAQVDTLKHVTFSAPAYISLARASEPAVSATAAKTAEGKVSAPVKGYAGVYMLQVLSKNKTAEEYDEKQEQTTLSYTAARYASQYLFELREKANVVDKRYLYF